MKQYIKILTLLIGTVLFGHDLNACVCRDALLRIDSLPQLKEYDFIAHVKIVDDQDNKKPSKEDYETFGLLTIKVIELFKGNTIEQILEYSKNTSCDIGVSKGEEWILFGKTINGKLAIVSCDRNQLYRESNEVRDWKYKDGFYELKQLRKLYDHPVTKDENGKQVEFYSNGQKEIEETYVNGKLNGERKIWYPNGVPFCRQSYINDTLNGKSEWFYPSGQIYDEDYYIKGQNCNVSRLYYDTADDLSWEDWYIEDLHNRDDSLKFIYSGLQAQYEIVFDSYGRAIISREYSRIGRIQREKIIDPASRNSIVIFYHDNGAISSIMYSNVDKPYGHYQTYDKNGFPDTGWDYDENGKVIRK